MLNCYCSTTSTTPALSASKCGITFYQSQAYPYIMTKLIYMFFISLTYQVFWGNRPKVKPLATITFNFYQMLRIHFCSDAINLSIESPAMIGKLRRWLITSHWRCFESPAKVRWLSIDTRHSVAQVQISKSWISLMFLHSFQEKHFKPRWGP